MKKEDLKKTVNSAKEKTDKNAHLSDFQSVETLGKLENSSASKKRVIREVQTVANPLHLLALIGGFLFFGIGYVIFIYGHAPGGIIFDLRNHPRMILAVMISVFAWSSLLWGFVLNRKIGFLFATLLAAGLCYLPWHYRNAYAQQRYASIEYLDEKTQQQQRLLEEEQAVTAINQAPTEEQIKQAIDDAIRRFKEDRAKNSTIEKNSTLKSTGLLLHGVPELHLSDIRELLEDHLGRNSEIKIYPLGLKNQRPPSILFSIKTSASEQRWKSLLHFIHGKYQTTKGVYETELRQSAVRPRHSNNNNILWESRFNTLELTHLSRARQEEALVFFSTTKTLINAPEVLQSLTFLLQFRDEGFQEDVIKTLNHWQGLIAAKPTVAKNLEKLTEKADQKVFRVVKKCLKKGQKPLPSMVFYLIEHLADEAESSILAAWKLTPNEYSRRLSQHPKLSKKLLTNQLATLNQKQLQEACALLRSLGDASFVAELEALPAANYSKKLQQLLQQTITDLKSTRDF